jgi:hypothetical protein
LRADQFDEKRDFQMTTYSKIAKRAGMTGRAVVWQPSALSGGSAERRVNCLSPSSLIPGGELTQEHAFRLEGVLRRDRRQIQI